MKDALTREQIENLCEDLCNELPDFWRKDIEPMRDMALRQCEAVPTDTPETDAETFNFANQHPAVNMNQDVVRVEVAKRLERQRDEHWSREHELRVNQLLARGAALRAGFNGGDLTAIITELAAERDEARREIIRLSNLLTDASIAELRKKLPAAPTEGEPG